MQDKRTAQVVVDREEKIQFLKKMENANIMRKKKTINIYHLRNKETGNHSTIQKSQQFTDNKDTSMEDPDRLHSEEK